LSERQISVLQLLAGAYSPDQIALKLGLTEATIRLHIRALKKKFGTESRDQMMAAAGQSGLCDPFETSAVHDQQEDRGLKR
jgi:DNA-binding NarL/FixJ family response regulator